MHNLEQDIKTYPGLIVYEISHLRFCSNIAAIKILVKPHEVQIDESYPERVFSELKLERTRYPLVNIPLLLNLKKTILTDNSRLLLYDSDTTNFFFVVDKIFHIVTSGSNFKEAEIIKKPSLKSDYLAGAINFENSEQTILDMEKIGEAIKSKI